MSIPRARQTELRRAALVECASIIEAAIGVDLGIYSELATTGEEQQFIEKVMRMVSDNLYARGDQ